MENTYLEVNKKPIEIEGQKTLKLWGIERKYQSRDCERSTITF